MNVMEEALRERIDPHLTRDNLSELAGRALGRPATAVSARALTGGCWNRVIAVQLQDGLPELVLKISAQSPAPGIEREYAVLRYFAERTPMRVPRPYLLDATTAIIPGPLLVMERLPGIVLHSAFHLLDATARRRVMEEVWHDVAELHRESSQGFGGVELPAERRLESWSSFWLPRFDAVLREAREQGHMDAATMDRIEGSRGLLDRALGTVGRSTLTHYDVWAGNVMVDPAKGRVTGYIDVPGFWADYARELSFMQMFGLATPELLRRYAEEHPLDSGFPLRTSIYNLKMHLKHVGMYPHESHYRQGVQDCLALIEASP